MICASAFVEKGSRVLQPLTACADDGDVYLVARGDDARAPEHVTWHDGGGRSGRGGGDELAAARPTSVHGCLSSKCRNEGIGRS